jgi:hypothetical protein
MTLRFLGPHDTVKIDVYRPTEVEDDVGGVTKTYSRVQKDISVVFEKLTGGRAQRLFGTDTKAKWRILAEETHDIEQDDVVRAKDGPNKDAIAEVDDVIPVRNRIKNIVLRKTDVVVP